MNQWKIEPKNKSIKILITEGFWLTKKKLKKNMNQWKIEPKNKLIKILITEGFWLPKKIKKKKYEPMKNWTQK